MAVAEDASSPAVVRSVTSSTSATITTASFTPPAQSLVIIYGLWSWKTAWTTAPTQSASLSAGGTPVSLAQVAETVRKFNVVGAWYAWLPTSPGAITATVTRAGSTAAAGGMLVVRVLTGAASAPNLLSAATIITSTSGSQATFSVTPLSAGSQLYVGGVVDQNTVMNAISSETSLDSWQDVTDVIALAAAKSTALTADTSAQNVGWVDTGFGSTWDLTSIAIEVPPASNPVIPPTGLTATVISSTEIDLSWNTVTGAKGYDLQRDGVVIATDLTGLSYADTGLSPSTTYTYDVRSVF